VFNASNRVRENPNKHQNAALKVEQKGSFRTGFIDRSRISLKAERTINKFQRNVPKNQKLNTQGGISNGTEF